MRQLVSEYILGNPEKMNFNIPQGCSPKKFSKSMVLKDGINADPSFYQILPSLFSIKISVTNKDTFEVLLRLK